MNLEMSNGNLFESGPAMDKPKASIMERAVCLSVELCRLGTRRKVASTEVQTDADPDAIHVSKEILESESLDEIKRLDGEIREYVNKRTVPGMSLFRSGVYLVPVDRLEEIDAQLETYKQRREALVERFMENYDTAARAAKNRLGSLYNEDDYPIAGKVRAKFGMETKYVAFSAPDKLKTISSSLYRREQAKLQAAVESATAEIRNVLRASMVDLVNHMVERLSIKPGEKAKTFRDSLVGNIREFLDNFKSRNIVDDAELARLVEAADSLTRGIDPETLRQSDTARERVAEGFVKIKAELDTMIVQRPGRKVKFD
jgi:hypothetical protein